MIHRTTEVNNEPSANFLYAFSELDIRYVKACFHIFFAASICFKCSSSTFCCTKNSYVLSSASEIFIQSMEECLIVYHLPAEVVHL